MSLFRTTTFLVILSVLLPNTGLSAPKGLAKIDHIVVIYLENRSFDSLFGNFPGANGLAHIKVLPQVDEYGRPYQTLPPVMANKQLDNRFPTHLPNHPFNIADYVNTGE